MMQSTSDRKPWQVAFAPRRSASLVAASAAVRTTADCMVRTFVLVLAPIVLGQYTSDENMAMMSAARRRVIGLSLVCAGLISIQPAHAAAAVDLARFYGRVVYLDFWASWCAPCRQSFPWMQALKNTYERQGLTVIAINLDHDRADAEQFLQQFHPDFAVQFDPQGTVAERFKVAGMPSSVFIDRHGVPRFTHIGFRSADREGYENELRALLAEK